MQAGAASGGERNGAMGGAEMVRAMAKAIAKTHLQQTAVIDQQTIPWSMAEFNFGVLILVKDHFILRFF